jgi:hypothetical protein
MSCPRCPARPDVLPQLSYPAILPSFPALRPQLSCLSCPAPAALPQHSSDCVLSYCHYLLSRSSRPVHSVLSRLTVKAEQPSRPVQADLTWLSCPRSPTPTVLSWLSFNSCPVLFVLSQLSCPGCHVLAVLSSLSCPCCIVPTICFGCPVLAVLSWLFCPDSPVPQSCPSSPAPVLLSPALL